jgi:Glyoxalase-like domain
MRPEELESRLERDLDHRARLRLRFPPRWDQGVGHSLFARSSSYRDPDWSANRPHLPDVRDSTWRVPILWFQETEEHETPRQRFHLDVQVPYDVADQRIAAALAAGGVVVHDSDPSYVVIADPDGNKACVVRYPHPA